MKGIDTLPTDDRTVASVSSVVKADHVRKTFHLPKEHSQELRRHIINVIKGEKGFTELKVLRDISFEVHRGDFFGIVGRNGSGKSTLLKLLAGIYQPTEGKITTTGRVVPFIELGVGFNPELSGRENVYLNGAMLGFSNAEIGKMYGDIVSFAELDGFMDQKLKNFSSGMQVRLAFSIAIKAEGDILILDEVLAVGDEAFQRKCNEYFSKVKQDETKTVILVTHGMAAVRAFCNRAILIENGEIVIDGDPDQVATEYSRQFITESETSITSETRYGSGKAVIENVSKTLAEDSLVIDFDIVNRTSSDCVGLKVDIEFVTNGVVTLGNSTIHIDPYRDGIALQANGSKHFTIPFVNIFGNCDFLVNMSLKDGPSEPLDVRKQVLKFSSSNFEYPSSWPVIAAAGVEEMGGTATERSSGDEYCVLNG